MIDLSNYPHLPFSIKQVLREFEEIASDEEEHPETRRYFQCQLDKILQGASDIEEIVSDAEMRGYSSSLNQHHGYENE